ncbi:MAG TPA: hypothetical protein VHQ24_16065 [Lachnospiraceae bacterium]|nr:hypothetical protein [Lachnospiraceae bacterium]
MGRSNKVRKRSVKKTYIIAVLLCYFMEIIIKKFISVQSQAN